jgi:hypothetical protein
MIILKFTKSGIKIKDADFNSNKLKVNFFLIIKKIIELIAKINYRDMKKRS